MLCDIEKWTKHFTKYIHCKQERIKRDLVTERSAIICYDSNHQT